MKVEVSHYSIPGDQLESNGPYIPVLIGNLICLALLDTGATISLIDIMTAREQNLPEAGTGSISGVTGTADLPLFDTTIDIPWLETTVPSPIQGSPLRTNDIPWNAVIGRDILLRFDFRIDGPENSVTFLKQTEDPQ